MLSNSTLSAHVDHVCLFSCVTTHFGCIFTARQRALASSCSRFLYHTQRHTTVGRTPLDEWSVRRRDLYLTTHNTHNRQTSMPPVGFELTISAGERPKTYALDHAATGTGTWTIFSTAKLEPPENFHKAAILLFYLCACFSKTIYHT